MTTDLDRPRGGRMTGRVWAAAVTALVVVSGCGRTAPAHGEPIKERDSSGLSVVVIETPNGPMQCVVYRAGYAGGLDCVPLGWEPGYAVNTNPQETP